jgi:MFS family permease
MDVALLFTTRIVRLFAYGFLSVVLVLYLAAIGIDEQRIGILLSLTLAGDVILSLVLTTRADAIGRRRTLLAGAVLMAVAAAVFASTRDFNLLLLAATIGVISPSGNEVGPFLAIEQVALAEVAANRDRTSLFAWYNLSGSFATAVGSLAGGVCTELLMARGFGTAASYRSVVIGYAILGCVLALIFVNVSPAIEREPGQATAQTLFRIERSRPVVLRLSALFALDSFAGGLVVQSVVAYWFSRRFGLSPALLGTIFFAANLLAGISALAAARIARRFGLINTMVFTHLPANVFLMLVPLMPNLPLALLFLMLRSALSQMDVPARTSYVMAVVTPGERPAAASVTAVPRSLASAVSPMFAGWLLTLSPFGWPLVICGGLKIVYDLTLLAMFRRVRPPEEQ